MKLISGKSNALAGNLYEFRDADELARGAAHYLTGQISQLIASRERVNLMLSGGSTPQGIYARLASPELAGAIEWSRVHIFWGDERCVSPDHDDSNFRMAYQTLISRVPLPSKNVHRIRGEITPQDAAREYERNLRSYFALSTPTPAVDFVLLGMGEDGHIASLFPGSPALEETQRWFVPVPHDTPPEPLVWRVTATFPLILAAREVVVIVSGEKKSSRLQQVLYGQVGETPLPAQRLREVQGNLVWMVDRAALKAALPE